MKYLIFGNGMIGGRFDSFLEDTYLSSVNICDEEKVKEEIRKIDPDVVINCAGKTGRPNIDWCEDNKLETLNSNVNGLFILLKSCQELRKYLVQVDSGCVYEGDNNGNGFSEDDEPNFFDSFYARSKIIGQKLLKEFDNVLVLRIRFPLLSEPDDRNYLDKILKYNKIIDVKNSVTIFDDFLESAKYLMENKKKGFYNIVNPGEMSPAEILEVYKEIVDPSHTYEVISLDELYTFTKAKRSNCVLNSDKLQREFPLKLIKERIREVLLKYKG
jgi:dTDP-4-dehydrorhamnose reductase